jgi:thiamine biosynthesis protein ThiI
VALWELMKRGVPVVPLYVGLGDYGGLDNRARAFSTVERLAHYAPNFDVRPRFAPAGDAVAHIADSVAEGRMVVLRRFMFRVAQAVAEDHDAVGIVTGESVGQKSSQTTANLAATSAVTDLPVHRPLLAMDKTDISALARDIGTYHESTIPAGCDRLAPDTPVTAISPPEARAREPDDVATLAREVADAVDVFDHGQEAPEATGGETA